MLFGSNKNKTRTPGQKLHLPLLPLRDVVIFPHMVVPLFVGREKSIKALEHAMSLEKSIFLCTQKEAKVDEPQEGDIHEVGTIGTVLQLLRLPDGTVKALVEGQGRGHIDKFLDSMDFFYVEVESLIEPDELPLEMEALFRSLNSTFEAYAKINKKIPPEIVTNVAFIKDPSQLCDTMVNHLSLKLEDKQVLLTLISPLARMEALYELMRSEIEVLQIEQRIKNRVKKQMERTQKEYYLNEQMRAIQKEMGDSDDMKNEIAELEEKIKHQRLSKEANQKIRHELKKLKMMSPMSAEATVVRNYIDWILALPWFERSRDRLDINAAEKILDEDHYGLEKPKERILEYLAVQSLVRKNKSPILCLVGPPGVGKTSLARSVARALGRNFVRLSLGGVRDEAEIRGHRRTYIGAMPGKIIQSLRKAKTSNPVFCLDEVDKMSTDFRGDPSAALLEVLDPEQNSKFSDHYLDLDYDLSAVLFITTANSLYSIPGPLQDRMEIIRISGYTEDEKLNIAKKFLIKKQIEANGLRADQVDITDNAILTTIRCYTREAGVRGLEREIASVCRKVAREILKNPEEKPKISNKNISQYLGIPKYHYGIIEEADDIGIVTGLAWTEVGGDTLTTEVLIMPGRGNLTLTGKLGEVMQESARAAMSYVRSISVKLGLDPSYHRRIDVHIHIPEGAIPKDGPSAGITLTTGLVSALTKRKVRRDVAMTGEVTLRGRVLPIGGLKEKIMAAHRGEIKTIVIPKENEKDLKDIPERILKSMEIISVVHVNEVFKVALVIPEGETLFKEPEEDKHILPLLGQPEEPIAAH
ncbi:MAG: DNA-binding protein [Candidatus Adiutrix intracellularis]|jgi:ATP-dependent Lon protease|nr:MAG: DNA-binding protein [Candidatus Adiutrix intracellularis]MDR2826643.1 endopeptidase La [Candidatus Adiutrix intracellularis]